MDGNGARHYDNMNINNTFRQFYVQVYESCKPEDALAEIKLFFEGLSLHIISDAQRFKLNSPITKEKVLLALHSLQSGKSLV